MTESEILALAAGIPPLDEEARSRCRERLDRLTKPTGSLGRLEDLAAALSAMTGKVPAPIARRAVLVFAADHGVAAEGVSAYPAEVTPAMVANFLAGGAAVNVLAALARARVRVEDVGVRAEAVPGAAPRRFWLAPGTGNLRRGPAMGREGAVRAIAAGIAVAAEERARGLDLAIAGDMGIGNSTAAACLASVFTGADPSETAGRGTGLDDPGLERKRAIVREALERNRPDPEDPIGALAAVGGLEIGAMAGAILAAAAARIPVLLDGYIAGAAALVAAAIAPRARDYLLAGHRSAEPGHRIALARLGLDPILDLGMRLGEGTGALVALPILDAAVAVLAGMATFEQAGVPDRRAPALRSPRSRREARPGPAKRTDRP